MEITSSSATNTIAHRATGATSTGVLQRTPFQLSTATVNSMQDGYASNKTQTVMQIKQAVNNMLTTSHNLSQENVATIKDTKKRLWEALDNVQQDAKQKSQKINNTGVCTQADVDSFKGHCDMQQAACDLYLDTASKVITLTTQVIDKTTEQARDKILVVYEALKFYLDQDAQLLAIIEKREKHLWEIWKGAQELEQEQQKLDHDHELALLAEKNRHTESTHATDSQTGLEQKKINNQHQQEMHKLRDLKTINLREIKYNKHLEEKKMKYQKKIEKMHNSTTKWLAGRNCRSEERKAIYGAVGKAVEVYSNKGLKNLF